MALTREQLSALGRIGADTALAIGTAFPGVGAAAFFVRLIGEGIAQQAGGPVITEAEFKRAEDEALRIIKAELDRGDAARDQREQRRDRSE